MATAIKTKKRPGPPPVEWIPITRIKLNPANPRIIKDEKFHKLVKSLQDFPRMLELRPIIVDETGMVLGGNMRLKAAKELEEFLFQIFAHCHAFSGPNAAAYIWYASRTHIQFEHALKEAGYQVKQQLIWNKGMSLGHADYHWAHEPVLYCKKASGTTTWYGDRTEKTILGPKRSDLLGLKKEELVAIVRNLLDGSTNWEIDRERTVTYKHPTQKPVPLAGRAIVNSSKERAIVLDPCAGSGVTMVASHQLARICYAMELEPRWCQVTINRMRKLAPDIEVTINGKEID